MKTAKIDRNLKDLHVNDYLNRLRLRDWLEQERDRQGYNNRELAALVGHQTGWAYGLINGGGQWRVASLQKIIRALGYTLWFNVEASNIVIPPPDGPKLSEIYANHPDMDQREEAARRDLSDLGRRYREALGLQSATLGKRLNQEGESVRTFESGDKPYYLLVTAQRYFRALGGELKLMLEKKEESGQQRIFEAPEGRWPSTTDNIINVVEAADRTMIWNSEKPELVVSFPADAWRAWVRNG